MYSGHTLHPIDSAFPLKAHIYVINTILLYRHCAVETINQLPRERTQYTTIHNVSLSVSLRTTMPSPHKSDLTISCPQKTTDFIDFFPFLCRFHRFDRDYIIIIVVMMIMRICAVVALWLGVGPYPSPLSQGERAPGVLWEPVQPVQQRPPGGIRVRRQRCHPAQISTGSRTARTAAGLR